MMNPLLILVWGEDISIKALAELIKDIVGFQGVKLTLMPPNRDGYA